MAKKKMPGLNTSSTADISFMLLIFFLVTTSMDSDKGLTRRLPPPPENQDNSAVQINERNILKVQINSIGKVRVETQTLDSNNPADMDLLCEQCKKFILGFPKPGEDQGPEMTLQRVPGLSDLQQCAEKHVISLQADRGTPYSAYFAVQDAMVRAYNEVRDEKSKKLFGGKPFSALNEDQQGAIRTIYPQKISEAEPIDYSKLSH